MGDLTTAVPEHAALNVQVLCTKDVLTLIDRKIGRGRWDRHIDLVAVGPAGVYVVDVKYYRGKPVEVVRSGGVDSPVKEQLLVGGRDRSGMLDSVARQLDGVRRAMRDFPGSEQVSVTAALCFVDGELPAYGTPQIGFIPCLGPKGTAKLLATPGELDAEARTALRDHLARGLPPG